MTFSMNIGPKKLSINCKLNWKLLYSFKLEHVKHIVLNFHYAIFYDVPFLLDYRYIHYENFNNI